MGQDIAIVGMDCMFPGAPNLDAFWANLRDGFDAITNVPKERWEPIFYDPSSNAADRFYCRRGGFLSESGFHALDFGVMPVAAAGAEPDQLLGLQVAHRALADAGLTETAFPRERTTVVLGRGNYIGAGLNRLEQHVRTAEQIATTLRDVLPSLGEDDIQRVKKEFQGKLGAYGPDTAIGLVPNLCASRIANRLDLGGSAYTVDGACASSLLALDHSVRDLRSGRADVALVGGIHLSHDVAFWSVFCQLGALSRTEQIRPFSADADGILIGEGLGFVVLRRLEDAVEAGQRIYAVIRGVGISSDGRSASLMSPSSSGQLLALERAWESAQLDPKTVGVVEAHGTGTPVGDAVELETLRAFFGPVREGDIRGTLGSVKSMIGHAMPASGMASLIKTALSIYHKTRLPSLHCESPHPLVEQTRFEVLSSAAPWASTTPRRGAVNAFGFGGINGHAVLEEAPESVGSKSAPVSTSGATTTLWLRAGSPAEIEDALRSLPDGATGTYGTGDAVRAALVDPTPSRRASLLKSVQGGKPRNGRGGTWLQFGPGMGKDKIAFLFPGIEAQFRPRSESLLRAFQHPVPAFQRPRSLEEHGMGVVHLGRALFEVITRVGIQPDVLAGHSVGEWTAMIASGMMESSSVDALIGGFERGMLQVPGVAFLSVGAGVDTVQPLIDTFDSVYLSHDNCPHQCVVVGEEKELNGLQESLKGAGILSQILPFQSGFHSPLYRPYLGEHRTRFQSLQWQTPRYPVWSGTHVRPFPDEEETVQAWALEHLEAPVRFREVVEGLYEEGVRIFLQLGVGSLPGFVSDCLAGRPHLAESVVSDVRAGAEQWARLTSSLFAAGIEMDAGALAGGSKRQPFDLELGVPLVRLPPMIQGSMDRDLVEERTGDPVVDACLTTLEEARTAARQVLDAFQQSSPPTEISPVVLAPTRRSLLFSVDNEPAWIDHTFFRQPEGWADMEDRYPVVPLTGLFEVLRTEAESVSRQKVVEIHGIRARKWLAVHPPVELDIVSTPHDSGELHVDVGGFTEGTCRLAEAYDPWQNSPLELEGEPLTFPLVVDDLYPDRWMFHGPAYQGIVELSELRSDGIRGVLKVGDAPGALLDNAGQLLGLWVMCTEENDRLAMPVQVKSIAFHGPHPEPETEVVCTVRVTRCGPREVIADMECRIQGDLWVRIQGWEDWRFETDERLWPMLQFPERHLLAEPVDTAVMRMDLRRRSKRSLADLARRFLRSAERKRWEEMKGARAKDWLAGRIAAIDAVRSLLMDEGISEVFPVQVQISNDASGAPLVSLPAEWGEVNVSLSHKDGLALAQARRQGGVGVDVEKIEVRTPGFVSLALTPEEQALLPKDDTGEWVTRAWCAKEVVGKSKKTGLAFAPKSWVVEATHASHIQVNGEWVETQVFGEYALAWLKRGDS